MNTIGLALMLCLGAAPAGGQELDLSERLSDATTIVVGTVDSVTYRYDSKNFPTSVVRIEVTKTLRGTPKKAILLTVLGGPSQDGESKLFHDAVNFSLLSPGVQGLFAVQRLGSTAEYTPVEDKITVFTRTLGLAGETCGLTAHNGILIDLATMKTDPHPPFPIRPGNPEFPTTGPELPRVNCRGAPTWEHVVGQIADALLNVAHTPSSQHE